MQIKFFYALFDPLLYSEDWNNKNFKIKITISMQKHASSLQCLIIFENKDAKRNEKCSKRKRNKWKEQMQQRYTFIKCEL